MSETRYPTQKRSVEKRNRIIETGFQMMCEKGFYNTNTSEIAKEAGVSTGIVYQYFNDKKEIFLEGVKNYSKNILYPMVNIFEKPFSVNKIDVLLEELIDQFIKSHTISKKAHEELMAMSYLDNDVAEIFKQDEMDVTLKIVEYLDKNHIKLDNPVEKIHIIYGIMDNLCHEIVYHKHDEIDYDVMKKEAIQILVNILKGIS